MVRRKSKYFAKNPKNLLERTRKVKIIYITSYDNCDIVKIYINICNLINILHKKMRYKSDLDNLSCGRLNMGCNFYIICLHVCHLHINNHEVTQGLVRPPLKIH